MTLYETLGITPKASQRQIHTAYRAKARKHHPDVTHDDGKMMVDLNIAYETLCDDDMRFAYDRKHHLNQVAPRRSPSSAQDQDMDELLRHIKGHLNKQRETTNMRILIAHLQENLRHQQDANARLRGKIEVLEREKRCR